MPKTIARQPTKEESVLYARTLHAQVFLRELQRIAGKFVNQYLAYVPTLQEQEALVQKIDPLLEKLNNTAEELNDTILLLQQRAIIPLPNDYAITLRVKYAAFQNAFDAVFTALKLNMEKLSSQTKKDDKKRQLLIKRCIMVLAQFADEIEPHATNIGLIVQAIGKRQAA